MLVGTYEHKIDSKYRIVLPSKFREELGDKVFSTIGIDSVTALRYTDASNNISVSLTKKATACATSAGWAENAACPPSSERTFHALTTDFALWYIR